MLKTVEIENFQSHKYSNIDFHSGINLLTGESDHGKSSIIKAIYWALFNRPLGEGYRSWFCDKNDNVRVAIEFTDNEYIVRERGQNLNRYITSKSEEPLDVVKFDVPDEVKEVSNIDLHNIQSQHDEYFLLRNTPGEVAKKFNNIIGLDIIDKATKEIDGVIRKATNAVKGYEEKVELYQKEIDDMAYLDDMEKELNKLGSNIDERELLREERSELIKVQAKLEDLEEDIKQDELWLEIEDEADWMMKEAEEIDMLLREIDSIKNDLSRIDQINKEMKELEESVRDYDASTIILDKVKEVRGMEKDRNDLIDLSNGLENLTNDIEYLEKKVETYQKELDEVGSEVCVECGRPYKLECPGCGATV